MMDIDRLQTIVTESAGALTARLAAGEMTPLAWAREMERTIVRAHTAAFAGAIGDRTGVAPRGLSRAERRDLEAAIAAQRPYLERFARDVRAGELSPEAIARRAELYAGPIRATYSKERWPGLPDHPASGGTPCLAWCKCSWVERSDGMHWTLGASEHCGECEARASDWAPWRGA